MALRGIMSYGPNNPYGGFGYYQGAAHFAGTQSAPSQGILPTAQPKKPGVVKGFLKGIVRGGVDMVKSIFTPKGMLMVGATLGLTWLTAGAILPPLAVLGMGLGGYHMVKGAMNKNPEDAGAGFFTFAASALGLKFTPKSIHMPDGGKAVLASSSGASKAGFLQQLKSPFGGKYTHTVGDQTQSLNLYQIAAKQVKSRFGWGKSHKAEASVSSSNLQPLQGDTVNLSAKPTAKPSELGSVLSSVDDLAALSGTTSSRPDSPDGKNVVL